jgi:hypothetical protein
MSLLAVIVVLICVGVVASLLKRHGGKVIDEPYLTWIIWLIVIATLVWLLNIIGVFDYFRTVPMPTLRGRGN